VLYFQRTYYNPQDFVDDKYHCFTGVEQVRESVERFNNMTEGKTIVDVKTIDFDSGLTMDREAFDRISRMLGSGDDELKNMAMRMLTSYNYTTEKQRIALLLRKNWKSWEANKNKRLNVDTKALLHKIQSDFYGFSWTNMLNKFMFSLILNYPEDEIVSREFSAWVKEQMGREGSLDDFKLVKI
jgi:hypothetical protein